jgi:peptidoglycan/LPS O-acetylase OafA/YrhL
VELTSKISYSVYLVHLPLFYVLKPYFIDETGTTAFLGFLMYGSLVYLISFINYKYFESYFLKLRGKHFTKNR